MNIEVADQITVKATACSVLLIEMASTEGYVLIYFLSISAGFKYLGIFSKFGSVHYLYCNFKSLSSFVSTEELDSIRS